METRTEKASFGAGCFWGVEKAFGEIPGVVETAVGYQGGSLDDPSYEAVCSDRTGHAEVVEVSFDPKRVSYDRLLEAFFSLHDPTQLNRQGPDHGSQYRSVIFTYTPEQAELARAAIERLNASGKFRRPIATVVQPAPTFWRAEDYHQKYFGRRPGGSLIAGIARLFGH